MNTTADDSSNGWDAIAGDFMARRSPLIGVATVRQWARLLAPHATLLDLGCGHGVPIAAALVADGFSVYGVEASPALAAEFAGRFPGSAVACEAAEQSRFFGRSFDGILAVGLMFLLPAEAQRQLVRRVASHLVPGGRLLFNAPTQQVTWTDLLTGRPSTSLGREGYLASLSAAGLALAAEHVDEGGNHYYDSVRL